MKEIASFLRDEFKENWSYIRHIEELRLKHAHAFFIIIGVMISISSFLIKPSDNPSLNEVITNYRLVIIAISSFVFLYGLFLCIFLAYQKKGYQHYRIVNSEIRSWFTKKYGEKNHFGFEQELSYEKTTSEIIHSHFFYWYLLVVLINIFAFMVLSVLIVGLIASSWSFKYNIILSAFLSICVLLGEVYLFIRVNKKIK